MNKEKAMKLRADDCVLIGGFVRKPAAGTQAGDSVLDENGVIELDVPAAWETRPLYVKPEQIVSRCPAREGLKVGDFVLCNSDSERGRYVGFADEINENVVVVKLAHNGYLRGFFKSEVSLIISSEELQERIGRAMKIAEKKRAYAQGGLPEAEKLIAEQSKEGGEA